MFATIMMLMMMTMMMVMMVMMMMMIIGSGHYLPETPKPVYSLKQYKCI